MTQATHVLLLGPFEVRRDDLALALPPSRKTRALLGYLAATAREHSREDLCALFWEGPDDPRGGLRWSLTKLRALVGNKEHECLVADHQHVKLNGDCVDIDLVTVGRMITGRRDAVTASPVDLLRAVPAASNEALEEAARMFRGEFLDGLDLPRCFRYHEWWVSEREAWRQLRVSILNELCRRLVNAPDRGIAYARARLLADPFDEEAHCDAIRLLTALGRPREALQQYEACRRMLGEQFNARPSAATEQARAAITAGAQVAPSVVHAPEPEVSVPLFGRTRDVLVSYLHHYDGNVSVAHDGTMKSELAGRAADPASRARALGNTARCLALVERDVPRAEALLAEAQALRAGEPFLDLHWGLGLVRAHAGQYEEATDHLEAAVQLARREGDHWAECECLSRLVTIALERHRYADAQSWSARLANVAAKLGEGSEAPYAATLTAIARFGSGEPMEAAVHEGIEQLRRIDARALVARALTLVAEIELERGRFDHVRDLAAEALESAEWVGRRSSSAAARALLALASVSTGDDATARRHMEAVASIGDDPRTVGAHARRLLDAAAAALTKFTMGN